MTAADFTGWDTEFQVDVSHGFLRESPTAPRRHNPSVILNTPDTSVLRVVREELANCDDFLFSVAFVSPRAIALLKQELVDHCAAGRTGTIVTSDFLGFNNPRAFEELLLLREELGIDVRLHESKAFHPKGYVFRTDAAVTAMMGSSNFTEAALVDNHEWNLKVSATDDSDLARQLESLITQQVSESTPLSRDWIEQYRSRYVPPTPRPHSPQLPPNQSTHRAGLITPNPMQEDALASLERIRKSGARRALIISATGTGKTILSALDARSCAPRRLLFVVHRETILDASIEAYARVFERDLHDFGKYTGSRKEADRPFVFASVQTLERHLDEFSADAFDYIIIDEAHRSAAESHKRIIDHFAPQFLLGMTATPERTDGANIFELYDFNVAYEIRLQHALENDLLAPFHYYGIADVTLPDGTTLDADTDPTLLVTPERIDHLVRSLETYTQAGIEPRGLIFCARTDEARRLSDALNATVFRGRQLRTLALTGDDSNDEREAAIRRLEDDGTDGLDYLLTVDIFNEGVDIPTINQVIMLRQTQSSIVFVQQLGRGLRKAPQKEYLVVLDFIANYANNYMIPIALFGDESLNKESLRKSLVTAEERGVLPGLSSVRFDRISQERVLAAISNARLDDARQLQNSIRSMHARLGSPPRLWDFWRFESTDPVVLANKDETFLQLRDKALGEKSGLSDREHRILKFVTRELLTAKRPHELLILRELLSGRALAQADLVSLFTQHGCDVPTHVLESLIRIFTLQFHTEPEREKTFGVPLAELHSSELRLTHEASTLLSDTRSPLRQGVDDIVRTGLALIARRYGTGNVLVHGAQYTRRDACRFLGWASNREGVINGYMPDHETRTCPIFVTLHKDDDVSDSTRYQDAILDRRHLHWFSKSKRTLASQDVRLILSGEYALPVFVKKDDAEGKAFYYLGEAQASDPVQTTMPTSAGAPLSVVTMTLTLDRPLDSALYDYFHPTLTV
ncbi:DUF3427 domain-containing protein [Microbacterium sp. JB110]|nr:DUF3427 domain-containing protein [Microbacterium sp. JB110]